MVTYEDNCIYYEMGKLNSKKIWINSEMVLLAPEMKHIKNPMWIKNMFFVERSNTLESMLYKNVVVECNLIT